MSWSNILKAKVRTNMADYFEGLLPDEFEESPLHPNNLVSEEEFKMALEDTNTTADGWKTFFNKFRKLKGKELRTAIRKETGLNPSVYDDDVSGTIEDYISNILESSYSKFSEYLSKEKSQQKIKEKPKEEPKEVERQVGDTIRVTFTGKFITDDVKNKGLEIISDALKQLSEDMDVEDIDKESLSRMKERMDKLKKQKEELEKLKITEDDVISNPSSPVRQALQEFVDFLQDYFVDELEIKPKNTINYQNVVNIVSGKEGETIIDLDTQLPLRSINLKKFRFKRTSDFKSSRDFIQFFFTKDPRAKSVYSKLRKLLSFKFDDEKFELKDIFSYEYTLKESNDFALYASLINTLSSSPKLKFKSKYSNSSLFDTTFMNSNSSDLNPNIKQLIGSSSDRWVDDLTSLVSHTRGESATVVATNLRNLLSKLEPVIMQGETIPVTDDLKIIVEGTNSKDITPTLVRDFFSKNYMLADADLRFLTSGTGYDSARRSQNQRRLSDYMESEGEVKTYEGLRQLFNQRIKRVSNMNEEFRQALANQVEAESDMGREITLKENLIVNAEAFFILEYFRYLEESDSKEAKEIISEFEKYTFRRSGEEDDKAKEIKLDSPKEGRSKLQKELGDTVYYFVYENGEPYSTINLLDKLKEEFKKVPPRETIGSKKQKEKDENYKRNYLQFSRKLRSVKGNKEEKEELLLEFFKDMAKKVGSTEEDLVRQVANDSEMQDKFSFASFVSLPTYIERKLDPKDRKFKTFSRLVTAILQGIKNDEDKEDILDNIEDFIDVVSSSANSLKNLFIEETKDYLDAFFASASGEDLAYLYALKRAIGQSSLVSIEIIEGVKE